MIRVVDYIGIEEEVRITFTDGQYIIGHIDSVEDEEESELGEPGISVFTQDGMYVGVGESEIDSIETMN